MSTRPDAEPPLPAWMDAYLDQKADALLSALDAHGIAPTANSALSADRLLIRGAARELVFIVMKEMSAHVAHCKQKGTDPLA